MTTGNTYGESSLLASADPVWSGAYLQRQHAFLLAHVFDLEEGAQAAAQVRIPAMDVPWQFGHRRLTADWLTVAALVEWCGTQDWLTVTALMEWGGTQVQPSLLYAVYVEQLCGRFQRCTAPWPSVQREALHVYCVEAFGVDFTDPVQMAAVQSAVCEAKRAAVAALYGVEEDDMEEEEDDEQEDGSVVDKRPF